MNLNDSLTSIKGVGEKVYETFKKAGLYTVGDLIKNFPRAYDKYEEVVSLSEAKPFTRNAVLATVKSNPKIIRYGSKSAVSFYACDDTGTFEVRFYNASYMVNAFNVGDKRVFRGVLTPFKDKLILKQPKAYTKEVYDKLSGQIYPIYSLTKGLTNDRIGKTLSEALKNIKLPEDFLTFDELSKNQFLPMDLALKNIHFPENDLMLYKARRRIVFDEFFNFYSMIQADSDKEKKLSNIHKMIEVSDTLRLQEALPYSLTNAQKKAIRDIFDDLSGDYLMNRLIQGDVGSGKTMVSVMALLMCAANGMQGAMMAPTEVLARQHYETIKSLTDKYSLCFKPVLLTGKMGAKDKREAYRLIKSGEANVILGTQALITEKTEFNNLALVITDEQHRFGVKQREALRDKGLTPHILVMSATPIPRTLALIVYAGLSISVIDELPKSRVPILNCLVDSSFTGKAYKKIQSEIEKGHQAYIICPSVEGNEDSDLNLKDVVSLTKELREFFSDRIRIEYLHGRMKADEKTRIMESFKNRDIDILVSTTVVEVGIDVPNATVILIENAERFGLAELHQLRGRVGRGDSQSYCILMSDTKSDASRERLKILNETNDGFVIANEDMKSRGPGELDGVKQSGGLEFSIGDISKDGDLMLLCAAMYDSLKNRATNIYGNLIDFRTI